MARKRKQQPGEYVFTVNAYEPSTMPLARLAEYLKDLAEVLGEEQSIHLIRIDKSSHASALLIDSTAEPKVEERIHEIESGDAEPKVIDAVARINRRLRLDNTDAVFKAPDGNNLIVFPGRRQEVIEYGPFNDADSIDGIPLMVGGTREEVPVHLETRGRDKYNCVTDRETAKRIAKYLFTTVIRAEGVGRWVRLPEGQWEMRSFWINDITPLGDVSTLSFKQSIEDLRRIPAKWKELADPIARITRLRHEDPEM